MHGCGSTFVLVVNAEVDSMGGVGIANKTSPRKAAIEKVQAELWQEYGVRDQRKKELEFLEKGGDPLDFKLWNGAFVSVQSTSVTDQHPDQFVTSEAKGSFAFAASPHGDSAESSGRPGTTRANSADCLMLFDIEHGFPEGGKSLSQPGRSGVAPFKQSFKVDGSHKSHEHGNSATFNLPRKAYKRRYRSRPNRDGARSSSTDVNPAPGCHGPRDVKGLISDDVNQNIMLNQNSKPTSITDDALPKTAFTNGQDDTGLDNIRSVESTKDLVKDATVDVASNTIAPENTPDEQINQELPLAVVKAPIQMDSNGSEAIQAMRETPSAGIEYQPSTTAAEVENQSCSCQMNDLSIRKGDDVKTDTYDSNVSHSIKVLDSESSCRQTFLNVDGNNDGEMCTGVRNVDPNGNFQTQTFRVENLVIEGDNCIKEKKGIEGINNSTLVNKESAAANQSQQDNGYSLQPEEELDQNESSLENKVNDQVILEGIEAYDCTQLDSGRELTEPSVDNLGLQNIMSCDVKHQDCVEVSIADLPEAGLLTKASAVPIEAQTSSGSESKLESKIDEDEILKEAQIIEAKRKRIAELSIVASSKDMRRKSNWDYVLEEMSWLANDFAQERIWKLAAASQISYRLAVAYRLHKQGKRSDMDAKTVAHTLAKAVMEFWQSVQSQETSDELKQQCQKNEALPVRAYAVRLLKFIKPNISLEQAEVPLTPDRISDFRILDLSWEVNLTEENLFYAVPPGAGETYRKSVESHVSHCEELGSTVQDEVETSACDAAADFEYLGNAYDEGEGETSTYNTSLAFESSKSSRYGQKKRTHPTHAEIGSDLFPVQCFENKLVTQQYALSAKRPGSTLNVSVPTKRMRTATRRVISPFTAGASGCIQLPNKTDASSCDANAFQDDRGLFFRNNLEVESAGEFENQLPFDSVEVSTRPKKKKEKHLNASYEQRWLVDSSFENEQRDPVKKRSENHLLESNGNRGLLGQPMIKKPKLVRQSQDNSFDTILPSGSPAASQMSNMSNPNKFIKMLGGRDRGRKAKGHKMSADQQGSGGSWSLFQDQALVVLVHDLGPNWELVSDAINSTLHFKCIFRKAKECKERHNFLMDGTSGDGAESAEDSGSSQSYPSTLPGIPKGSARQLFQRLQGPMEEDTLKSHFEKIILIGQKLRCRKTQEPKQLQQPHSSQAVALSQVCPNNLNGGHILMPLDLCDASVSGPDLLSLGYQGLDSSGLAIPDQASVNPMLPASGARSALQGSPNMMTGNNFPSSPGTLSPSARDGSRYVGPRPGSLPADEQQRLQQYNQMIPGRNMPQPDISAPNDYGVRMVPGVSGLGMMGGANRSLPIARPGFRGMPPSSLVNPGSSMVSPVMSPANIHAGVGAGQGSSMLKARENTHTIRPGLNHDCQRQNTMRDLQILGNSQGPPHFSSLSPPFSNQTPPPVPSYPLHHHPPPPLSPQPPQVSPHHPHLQAPPPNQPLNPQQQAYAIRLAKERQLQHRLLQQQKRQLASSSNPVVPHAQSQPQLPISSPMQNNSPQASSPPTQGGGIVQNAPTGVMLTSQTVKQRQRPQNQLNRQHPQQRQQQTKVVKGVGRGNPNGVSTNPGQYVSAQPTNQSPPSKMLKLTSQSDNSSEQTPSQQKSVNQNQLVLRRAAQINSDPSNKPQVRDCDTSISISGKMDKATTLPQVSNNATDTVQIVSQAVPSSLPHIRQDVSTQQTHSMVHKSQQMVQPFHSQQQAQLLQGNGDLHGRSNEPRFE